MKPFALLVIVNCVAGVSYAQTNQPPPPAAREEVIAVVMGRNIAAKDKEKLLGLILEPILDKFAVENKIEPTKEEVEAYVVKAYERDRRSRADDEAQRQKLLAELKGNTLSGKQQDAKEAQLQRLERLLKESLEREEEERALGLAEANELRTAKREFARHILKTWKINQALHAKYGGRVLFEQAGPQPLDAFRQVLREAEKKGSFQILNKQVEADFWRTFTDHRGHRFYPKELEAKAFSSPWGIEESAPK